MDLDDAYMRLRADGFLGWGGPDAARRIEGWKKVLARLTKEGWLPEPPARVHELGCGNGILSFLVAERGYSITGTDLSWQAVDWARERFARAGLNGYFYCGDVCAMPMIEDGALEVVIDGNCIHCLFGEDRRRCFREVRRVLAGDGTFVVSSMCGPPKSEEAMEWYDATLQCLMRGGRPYRSLKPAQEIESELAEAGFGVVSREISVNAWWDHLTVIARPSSAVAKSRCANVRTSD